MTHGRTSPSQQKHWTVEEIAGIPRWSAEQIGRIDGYCRGFLLRHWAENIRDRWGDSAVTKVREHLGDQSIHLPDVPMDTEWYPVSLQLQITDWIIEYRLDGDALALEELLREDSMRHDGAKLQSLVGKLGPQVILRLAKRIHSQFYNVGLATSHVGWGKATIQTMGSLLFHNPTWQLLHLFGLRGMMQLAGRDLVEIFATLPAQNAIDVHLRW